MTTRPSHLIAPLLTLVLVGACGDDSSSGGDASTDVRSDVRGIDGGGPPPPLGCAYPEGLNPAAVAALEARDGLLGATPDELINGTLEVIEANRTAFDEARIEVLGLMPDGTPRADGTSLTAINWVPTHDAYHYASTSGSNAVVLESNHIIDDDGTFEARGLAILGDNEGGSGEGRYAVLGSFNLFDEAGADAQMVQFLRNTLGWLTRGQSDGALRVTLAQLADGFFFPDRTAMRAWLMEQYGSDVTFNEPGACDGDALAGCLDAGTDLLVLSDVLPEGSTEQDAADIMEQLRRARADGTPVLFSTEQDELNPLGALVMAELRVQLGGSNRWNQQSLVDADNSALLGALPAELVSTRELLSHLQSGDYGFTLSEMTESSPEYASEFGDGAMSLRERLRAYDEEGQVLFRTCGYEVDKLLVLLADRLRQDTRYPMNVATDQEAFMRALFADHVIYNSRDQGPAQPDRGTFDPKDLSDVTPETVTVELLSRQSFRSAGVYVLPGRSVRVTRLDDSDVDTAVFVNSLRDTTKPFEDEWYGGYARPVFLRSASIPVRPGESITLNNPHGGPLQVTFSENDQTVRLQIEGVGQHPHWRTPADNASFAARLSAGTYGWAEVATPGFELHSEVERLGETLANPRWNTPETLAAAIELYTFNHVHVLSGEQGNGVDDHPDVAGWAASRGFERRTIAVVKHGNMDVPLCGWGCSGNPYDAGWAFGPTSHGDLHELGHSIQRRRFELQYGSETQVNHSVTNWWAFYSKSRSFADHGSAEDIWEVDHGPSFDALQAAHRAGERDGDFSTLMRDRMVAQLTDTGPGDPVREGYVILMQAMAAAVHAGSMEDGYLIVPRVHILENAFEDARENDETWAAERDAVGFGRFAREEAMALSNNDFMAIAVSSVTGLDYRDFFAMWGVEVSATAQQQIADFGFPAVSRAFFALDVGDHVQGRLSNAPADRIMIDGSTPWPHAP